MEDNLLLAHRGHGPVQHQLPPLWRAQILVSMKQWVKKTEWGKKNPDHVLLEYVYLLIFFIFRKALRWNIVT